jgi:hypothetical protein
LASWPFLAQQLALVFGAIGQAMATAWSLP